MVVLLAFLGLSMFSSMMLLVLLTMKLEEKRTALYLLWAFVGIAANVLVLVENWK